MALNAADVSCRVLLFAPTKRDAQLAEAIFAEAGIACTSCDDMTRLCALMDEGVGAVLLPEEAFTQQVSEELLAWLKAQKSWSDVPILVLTRGGADSPAAARAVELFGNVTLLERPLRVGTLVSSVRTALRARHRQYQLREQLEERARLNQTLELRVRERTAVAEQRAIQLSALAVELTQAEARERRRLAQVLHDHLQQLLVAGKLKIGMARSRPEDAAASLEQVEGLLNESIEVSRSLAVELSPPILYEAGLVAAVQWLARWMQEKHGLVTTVNAEPDAEPGSEDLRVLLFQVAQELLFNVVKHADVDQATLTLERVGQGRLRMVVEDRGRGFAPESTAPDAPDAVSNEHFGLFSIRERLRLLEASLVIASTPGEGTRITVEMQADKFYPPRTVPAPLTRH